MLEAARDKAKSVLLDQVFFSLDTEKFRQFNKLLDAAPARNPGLERLAVSESAGVRALLVHALHERAKQFYEYYGFQSAPSHPMTLMLRMSNLKA